MVEIDAGARSLATDGPVGVLGSDGLVLRTARVFETRSERHECLHAVQTAGLGRVGGRCVMDCAHRALCLRGARAQHC